MGGDTGRSDGHTDAAQDYEAAITKHVAAEALRKRLLPPPFATWGANAYLSWKEHRAGAEW